MAIYATQPYTLANQKKTPLHSLCVWHEVAPNKPNILAMPFLMLQKLTLS